MNRKAGDAEIFPPHIYIYIYMIGDDFVTISCYIARPRARICDAYDAAAHRTSAMLRRSHQLSCCDEYSGILTARSELSAHVRAPRLWASKRLAMCCAALLGPPLAADWSEPPCNVLRGALSLSLSRSFAHRLPARHGETTTTPAWCARGRFAFGPCWRSC